MKIQTFFTIILFSAFSIAVQAQNEEEAIKKTLLDYLDGGTNGDVTRFKSAFVPDAIQKSVSKAGGITGMTVESLSSKIKPGQVMDRKTAILSWSYANDAATAVTETVYATSKIIDLLNLLKVNGEWKIVSRVFSRLESNEQVSFSSGSAVAMPTASKATPSGKQTPPPPAKKKPVSDDGWK